MREKDLFHVHTYRCKHAEEVSEEEYIKKAMELGATGIWFTDHAPFPDRIWSYTMDHNQLEEYLDTVSRLKEKYSGKIDVHVGLEIEYYPSYDKRGYYKQLKEDDRVELLLLGQHLAEVEPGVFTISWGAKRREEEEFKLLGEATCQGMRTGYFDVVAHPDRVFRRRHVWTEEMEEVSRMIGQMALETGLPLEQNEESKREDMYWEQFWELVPKGVTLVHGLDAHYLQELIPVFYSASIKR